MAAIAKPRRRHGRHAPKLPAAQNAQHGAGRQGLHTGLSGTLSV